MNDPLKELKTYLKNLKDVYRIMEGEMKKPKLFPNLNTHTPEYRLAAERTYNKCQIDIEEAQRFVELLGEPGVAKEVKEI